MQSEITLSAQDKANNAINWIYALQSGDYIQGRIAQLDRLVAHELDDQPKFLGEQGGRLVGDPTGHKYCYCCLGVANEVMHVKQTYEHLLSGLGLITSSGSATELVITSVYAASRPTQKGQPVKSEALMYVNDDSVVDFDGIAELLIEHPHNFFESDVAELIRKHFVLTDRD